MTLVQFFDYLLHQNCPFQSQPPDGSPLGQLTMVLIGERHPIDHCNGLSAPDVWDESDGNGLIPICSINCLEHL